MIRFRGASLMRTCKWSHRVRERSNHIISSAAEGSNRRSGGQTRRCISEMVSEHTDSPPADRSGYNLGASESLVASGGIELDNRTVQPESGNHLRQDFRRCECHDRNWSRKWVTEHFNPLRDAAVQVEWDSLVQVVKASQEYDFNLIEDIGNDPCIYRNASDDLSPEYWTPNRDEQIKYLLAFDWESGCFMGFCAFFPQNGVCYDLHLAFLPESYGPKAGCAFRKMLNWMWSHTTAKRITGSIPIYNRRAIAFAKRMGGQVYGVNPQSWLKDGRLRDQILIGVSKP